MHVINQIDEWLAVRHSFNPSLSIGFVPTMGNLHPGHASLMAASRQANDLTVASLFINPTQFNRPDDFTHYPRSLDADLSLLESNGVDYCLIPTEQAMYEDGYQYRVDETRLSQHMEGQHRPGHFTGVLTVVMKLLNLIRPNIAYFGEKDYQQFLLIRDMVKAFFMPISVQACPTVREASGLAYSSRNNRLTPSQRVLAETFARIFHQDKPISVLMDELKQEGITVEYMEEQEGRRLTAVMIGDIRLIDNYSLLIFR